MKFGIAPPARLGVTRLPQGRFLGWAEWGPEQGLPVLFFSGAAMGRGLGFGADVLERLGIRLIALERPGLGASDPDPHRSLGDWAGDAANFAAARELAELGIVAFSQGAPFGLACAAAGLGSALALVSGQDDLSHPDMADLLDETVAKLVREAEENPAEVESRFMEIGSADALWSLVAGYSPPVDLVVYTDPEFERVYRAALADGFNQGAGGYARDLVLAISRWPIDLGAITIPVDLWYGAQDTSPVHSPDHGATLTRRIPNARRNVLDDAGGSILWTHAAEILQTLRERMHTGSA
jgi:pimeloyl-ACP methyl ester carboxylesterase